MADLIYTILFILFLGIICAISWCVPDRNETCKCEGCKNDMSGWLSKEYKIKFPDHKY